MAKLEDNFSAWEILYVLKSRLAMPEDRKKYYGAPSSALRRLYLYDFCMSLAFHTRSEGCNELHKRTTELVFQLQDAMTIEDWEYEMKTTYNAQYRYTCRKRIERLKNGLPIR